MDINVELCTAYDYLNGLCGYVVLCIILSNFTGDGGEVIEVVNDSENLFHTTQQQSLHLCDFYL